MPKIAIDQISYSADDQNILNSISLTIKEGETFALLGENGSGKTSMIEVLTGVVSADHGKVSFNENKRFNEIKSETGVLWDNINIFSTLKVKEAIYLVSNLYGLKPNDYQYIYDLLELSKIKNRFMQKLSRGEQRRVQILLTTMHAPRLLILDEPTAELDPLIREKIWNSIFLKARTILFTTHQWEITQKYATSIAFIYKGKVLNEPASYEEVISSFRFRKKIITTSNGTLDIPEQVFGYQDEDKRVVLVPDTDHPFVKDIRKTSVNYSILPVELKDVYQFLIYQKG